MKDVKLFRSVLLLEDEPSHAFIIRRALGRYAEHITHVPKFSDALAAAGASRFDLIVSDLHLPDSGPGRDIAALCAAAEDAPVIVLTASTSLREAVEAMKVGARDFIVKDFSADFEEVFGFSLSRMFAALRLEEEKRKLLREMATLRVAIENSNDGLAVTDSRGVVRYANSAFRSFARRCGGSIEELENMFSPAVNRCQELQASVKSFLQTLSAGAVWQTEIGFVEGESSAFDLSLSVVPDPSQGTPDCVVWARDVSEVRRREKFQREILSTTSHDLKGPLGAIALSSELLKDASEKGERVYEIALRIGSAAQGAINLIDEFLSARRLREGNFIMKPTPHDIAELIEEVRHNYEAIAQARKIVFDVAVDAAGTAAVDRLGFERVLGNLLNNGFKFTPSGGRVSLYVARTPAGDVRVEVRDTGSGMEPSEVQKIFQRFSRLERHSDIAGSGLGLFVVKSIVGAHGGKVEVMSKLGEGTTFQITFPAHPPVNEHGELISLDF